jgi:hypothetical protein
VTDITVVVSPAVGHTVAVSGSVPLLSPDTVAAWDASKVRHFGIDAVNGDDTNLGYVDADIDSVDVDTLRDLCVATEARLWQLIPRNGAGRMAIIHWANNSHVDGVAVGAIDMSGFANYRYLTNRAWSAYLTGEGNECWGMIDRRVAGARIAIAGPNVDGSFTVATADDTNTLLLTVAAGGSVLASEAATGFRLRFEGNVSTDLANCCCTVSKSATDTLDTIQPAYDDDWVNTTPVAGDKFWIERPGIVASSYKEAINCARVTQVNGVSPASAPAVIGFGFSGGAKTVFLGGLAEARYVFCEIVSSTTAVAISACDDACLRFASDFFAPDGSYTMASAAFRFIGQIALTNCAYIASDPELASVCAPVSTTHGSCSFDARTISIAGGVFLGGLSVNGVSVSVGTNSSDESYLRMMRIVRVLEFAADIYRYSSPLFYASGIDCDNGLLKVGDANAPKPCTVLHISNVKGGPTSGCLSTHGIYTRNSVLARIVIDTTCTVTGASGDIRLSDDSVLAYTTLNSGPHEDATQSVWRRPVS